MEWNTFTDTDQNWNWQDFFTGPGSGAVTQAMVPFYNPTTGQRWLANTGGYSPKAGSGWQPYTGSIYSGI